MPELLSPVGCMEHLYAAVNNGCNAVYLGGKKFNARASAENFSDDQLRDIIDYCHLRGVKVFITLNTLYKNSELNDVLKFASDMYALGADAFILQDIGIANYIKIHMPHIALHASTQLTAHSLEDVLCLEQMGFQRVVLSRELSLEEIRYIVSNCNTEIEVFIHGAICISFSGRCLMSSSLGKRSGNRGTCSQPCRMLYKENQNEGFLLSPMDMMTLDILDEIVSCGVTSLKIEGRQKSPEYVALTTKTYRDHLDMIKNKLEDYKPNAQAKKDLLAVFNRGGKSDTGYFKSYNAPMSTKTPKNTGLLIGTVERYNPENSVCDIRITENLIAGDGIEIWTNTNPHVGTFITKSCTAGTIANVKLRQTPKSIKKGTLVYRTYDKRVMDYSSSLYAKDERKLALKGQIYAVVGEPIRLTLSYKDIHVEIMGDVVQKAESHSLSYDEIIHRLSKTGNTTFTVSYEVCTVSQDVYFSVSALNRLRRDALEMMQNRIINSYRRQFHNIAPPEFLEVSQPEHRTFTALVRNKAQFDSVIDVKLSIIYVEYSSDTISNLEYYVKRCSDTLGTELFIALPALVRKSLPDILMLEQSGIDGYLVRTYGQLWMLKDSKKKRAIDYHFNIFNNLSKDVFLGQGAYSITPSVELSHKESKKLCGEVLAYGRPALMTIQGTHLKYSKITNKDLIDFDVIPNHEQGVTSIHKSDPILCAGFPIMRFEFTIEDAVRVGNIVLW